jgi:hypothetical protein
VRLTLTQNCKQEDLSESQGHWHLAVELYRTTFEQKPVGFAHTSFDGRFLLAKNFCCKLLGYSLGHDRAA